MEKSDSLEDKLYNALSEDRESLVDILSEMNDYDTLKDVISKIEKKHSDKNEVWHDLCTGKIGDETNKFSAIYEIPTKQLINSLTIIFQIYNINKIDEVGAGMGLLTSLLQKKFDEDYYKVKLLASDNCSSDVTNIPLDFTKIVKKDVSDIIFQHKKNLNPPDGVICCWPTTKEIWKQISDLIKSKCAKVIILITEIRQKSVLPKEFKGESDYRIYDLPIYQSSYLDVYENNIIDGLYSRSKTFILVRKDLEEFDLTEILSPNLYERKEIDPSRIALLDLAIIKKIPYWICALKTEEELKAAKKIFESIKKNSRFYKKEIPDWIPNMDLLIFWYSRKNKKMFPIRINTEEKLREYQDKVINMTPEKIKKLKDDGDLPDWISPSYIDMYFWLMYSVPDNDTGKWKENIGKFNQKFNQVYGYRAGSEM